MIGGYFGVWWEWGCIEYVGIGGVFDGGFKEVMVVGM